MGVLVGLAVGVGVGVAVAVAVAVADGDARLSPLLIFEYTFEVVPPITVRTAMAAIAISTRIRAYSTIPCPRSASARAGAVCGV